ncbi:MAG: N-acetylmuramoyl-L-alanine amidase family 2 [Actinomycetia bacterium]|nr:N-acetylmuramoyl-L-alanine amidase family 2 [Actinomycetes bacterium]
MRHWPRSGVSLLVIALVAPLVATVASAPSADAAVSPALVWKRELPGAVVRESSPGLADLDADGKLDVVFGSNDHHVYALTGETGANVAGWPALTTGAVNSSPAFADVTGDGTPEVFIGSGVANDRSGGMYAFGASGRVKYRRAFPDPDFPNGGPIHSTPALGDIQGNGDLEATVGVLEVRSLWSVRASDGASITGRELFYWGDTMFSSPALADVTGDGVPEVIVGGDSSPGGPINFRGGMVRAVNAAGRSLWEFRINDIVRSSPAVGDIDGDGRPEVVFGAGDYWHGSDATSVFALDATTGKLKWRRATDGVTDGGPALADLNGDGRLDVAIATFNSNSIRPGDVPLDVKGGSVYALDGRTGADMNGFPQASGGGAVLAGITTADLDGDGGQDLVVPTGALIAAFSGKTGARLFNVATGERVAFQSSAALADVDADGKLDLVAVGTRTDGTGVAYRWELPAPARSGALGWHQFHKDSRRTGSWTSTVPDAATIPFTRTAGADRYSTAVALSAGAATGGTVYVATGGAFADALAGGPAAAHDHGPLLLTARDSLPDATRQRLVQLKPSRIRVLGGPAAVSDAVVAELNGLASSGASRLAGDNRFGTAAAISAAAFTSAPVAYVATGAGFPDALAGAAAGALRGGPVLLVERDSVPARTAAELQRLKPSAIVVLGGTGAVSSATADQLKAYSPSVTRASGADRYATAVAVSQAVASSPVAYLATGVNFPDALAGGVVAAAAGAPLLLVPGRCIPNGTRAELVRLGVTRLVLLGGDGAVSSALGALPPCT